MVDTRASEHNKWKPSCHIVAVYRTYSLGFETLFYNKHVTCITRANIFVKKRITTTELQLLYFPKSFLQLHDYMNNMLLKHHYFIELLFLTLIILISHSIINLSHAPLIYNIVFTIKYKN